MDIDLIAETLGATIQMFCPTKPERSDFMATSQGTEGLQCDANNCAVPLAIHSSHSYAILS